MPRIPTAAGSVRWMLVVVTVIIAAWFAHDAAAQSRTQKSKEPKAKEFQPKRAVERVVEIDVIDFDPYWRDGCLLLAESLQPLADIAKKAGGDISLDEEKRRAAAAPIAKEVEELRRNAGATRKIRVLWLPISDSECRAVFVSQDVSTPIEAGTAYEITTTKLMGGKGFVTRLRPTPDPSVAKEPDVGAAAERIRGMFAPVDVEACTAVSAIRTDTKSGAKKSRTERFDRALAPPPEWIEGPDAIRSLKVSTDVTEVAATGSARSQEVTVRIEVPKFVNSVSRVTFNLFEKSKDGSRGAKVNAGEPLVAWGYAGRPALRQVPVREPAAHGYDVELVDAKYR